jgi:hypothetical protein
MSGVFLWLPRCCQRPLRTLQFTLRAQPLCLISGVLCLRSQSLGLLLLGCTSSGWGDFPDQHACI